jgi:hypothetical protein
MDANWMPKNLAKASQIVAQDFVASFLAHTNCDKKSNCKKCIGKKRAILSARR